jgi:hypothetical protein
MKSSPSNASGNTRANMSFIARRNGSVNKVRKEVIPSNPSQFLAPLRI